MEEKQHQQPLPDPESLLSLSAQLLGFRDFSGARKYALMAQRSDPGRTEPPQIIAVADILLSAQKRLPDWASVLQLDDSMAADRACMRSQFTKLTALVHPSKNRFPFSQEAFDHVCSAWAAMTAEEKGKSPEESGGDVEKEEGERWKGESGTFWTVCPYCFYAYEYESVYEDCCLRCQNCRKGFHGLVVEPPPVADGTADGYSCGCGYFPLKYSLHHQNGCGNKKDGVKGFVMEISDDSSEEGNGTEEKESESERKKQCGNEGKDGVSAVNMQSNNAGKKGNYRKSIPKNPKKMMGTGEAENQDSEAKFGNTCAAAVEEGTKSAENLDPNETDDEAYDDCDFDILVGEDDDVYVSFKGVD